MWKAVADPEFSRRGWEGCQTIIGQNICQKMHENEIN